MKARAPLLATACLVALAGLALASAPGSSPASPDSSPASPPLPPPSTGRFVLGINEAVSVPRRLLEGADPTVIQARLARAAATTADLGAVTVRGHTGAYPPISFAEVDRFLPDADTWVAAVQAAGLEPVMMVSPWPANKTARHTDTYLPKDLDAYAAYVRRVVERYDGDGVDDMPGLARPVRWWEVDNEPDLKWTGARGEQGIASPAEYARVLVVSAAAIRAASPDARVLFGGLFRPHADSGEAYLRDVLAEPGARDAFDVLSLHTYAEDEGDKLALGIRRARALAPDRPTWVTETSVSSDPDPDRQARVLVALVARAAVEGAERVYWHTLADPPPHVDLRGGLGRNSLLTSTGEQQWVEKPAAATFRHLSARLAEDDLVGATDDGDGGARLRNGATVLWRGSRIATHGGWDLRTGAPLVAGATAAAPAWLKGP